MNDSPAYHRFVAPPGQGPQAAEQREFRLRVPAQQRYAEVARLATTGVAARNGCRDDEVEALEVAFDEAFAALTRDPGPTHLVVTAEVDGDGVMFELTPQPDSSSGRVSLRAQR